MGCQEHRQDRFYCVDQNQNVVEEQNCRKQQPLPYRYHWFYGVGAARVPMGRHVDGKSVSSPATESEGTTERGVFGGAGEASGGHGSEGGGE